MDGFEQAKFLFSVSLYNDDWLTTRVDSAIDHLPVGYEILSIGFYDRVTRWDQECSRSRNGVKNKVNGGTHVEIRCKITPSLLFSLRFCGPFVVPVMKQIIPRT